MKAFATAVSAVMMLAVGSSARAGGGIVLPPTAKPAGYSLQDMAEQLAYFSTSANNLSNYPATPFQILYADLSTGATTNSFTVKAGTSFFAPVVFVDDSPPVIGTFPTNNAGARTYYFDPQQLGATAIQIEVDGRVTTLGPAYVAGPTDSPGLLDGGGSHYTQIGVFLSPLSPGVHVITISGELDGAAIGGVFAFNFTYIVTVE